MPAEYPLLLHKKAYVSLIAPNNYGKSHESTPRRTSGTYVLTRTGDGDGGTTRLLKTLATALESTASAASVATRNSAASTVAGTRRDRLGASTNTGST